VFDHLRHKAEVRVSPDKKQKLRSDCIIAELTNHGYRRTLISGTKKAQITFPLRHFFPLKVVK
jgi:hypothetical protein